MRNQVENTRPVRGQRSTPQGSVLVVACVLALGLAAAIEAAEHRSSISESHRVSAGTFVEVENLAGQMRVVGGGSELSLSGEVVAEGKSGEAARKLAEQVKVKVKESGGRLVLSVAYPLDRYDTICYSDRDNGSGWFGNSRSNVRYQGERVSVVSKCSSRSAEVHANLELRLPAGVEARVRNVVGRIDASGLSGKVELDTASGDVVAEDGDGELTVDTGSGDVEVRNHRGAVNADTGSGDVDIIDAQGDVLADTGSGDVRLERVDAEQVAADTGSGSINLRSVSGSLELDTGSGNIRGTELTARGRLLADTGSGNVDLEGDFSQVSRLEIDTGSGGVTLEGNGMPDFDLRISTGSGGINVDLPGVQVLRDRKGSYHGRLGSGDVSAEISTGSGGVRVRGGR